MATRESVSNAFETRPRINRNNEVQMAAGPYGALIEVVGGLAASELKGSLAEKRRKRREKREEARRVRAEAREAKRAEAEEKKEERAEARRARAENREIAAETSEINKTRGSKSKGLTGGALLLILGVVGALGMAALTMAGIAFAIFRKPKEAAKK